MIRRSCVSADEEQVFACMSVSADTSVIQTSLSWDYIPSPNGLNMMSLSFRIEKYIPIALMTEVWPSLQVKLIKRSTNNRLNLLTCQS